MIFFAGMPSACARMMSTADRCTELTTQRSTSAGVIPSVSQQ